MHTMTGLVLYMGICGLLNAFYFINIYYLARLIINENISIKKGIPVAAVQLAASIAAAYCRYKGISGIFSAVSGIASYLLIFLFAYILVKRKSTALYMCLIYLVIDSIIQSVTSLLVATIIKSGNTLIIPRLTALVFNVLLMLAVRQLLKKYAYRVRSSVSVIHRNIYILVIIALLLTASMCGCLDSEFKSSFAQNNIIAFMAVLIVPVLLVVLVSLIIYSISSNYYEKISHLMEKQVGIQLTHYERMDELSKEIRKFRHDYKNHLRCIQAYINDRDFDGANRYLKNITNNEVINSDRFSSGNHIANAILNDKNATAQSVGAEISFTGNIASEISPMDLCTILFNALDNAIEACQDLPEGIERLINVKCAVTRNIQVISISNPNIKERDLSTSKENKYEHGFGLNNIYKSVDRLGGEASISCMTPVFTLDIEFPLAE